MVSIDLKDMYLQIPVHPDSRQFLQFVALSVPYQFKALCFGLSTAPLVFTQVMAPVSAFLHRLGVRMLRYLDDWLVLASSWTNALWARDMVLALCCDLQILVNLAKSRLVPARSATYLGMTIVSPTLRAFPSQERVLALLTQLNKFLSYRRQSVVSWRSLLGHLSSLCLLVPGGRLRMRSLQLVLRSNWDFVDESVEVEWPPSNLENLLWWSDLSHHLQGVSLEGDYPDFLFWSDVLDQGWCAHLRDQFISVLWSPAEHPLSINLQELRAIHLGLFHFRHLLRGQVVGVFTDNTTALSYVRNLGNVLLTTQHQSPAPPLLGEGMGNHPGSPVHYGVQECSSRLAELSPSGPGFRMDPFPERSRLPADFVAGDGGPVHHGPELLPASLFLTTR